MCWAQHFTLDIPLMPLHCTPQNPDLSPGQRADWPHIYRRTASLCDGGRIWRGGGRREIFQQTGDVGSHRFPF